MPPDAIYGCTFNHNRPAVKPDVDNRPQNALRGRKLTLPPEPMPARIFGSAGNQEERTWPGSVIRLREIVNELREGEALIAGGATVAEASQKLGISDQTYYPWRPRKPRTAA